MARVLQGDSQEQKISREFAELELAFASLLAFSIQNISILPRLSNPLGSLDIQSVLQRIPWYSASSALHNVQWHQRSS